MLITFEGIDGCGKSTQVKLLADYLETKGYKVHILREPGGTEISEAIRNVLLTPGNNMNNITELLLFEAARSEIVDKVIKPKLDDGYFVICDRFYDSTTAYQGFGRNIPIDYINKLNFFATKGIKPDITFYLDIPLTQAQSRINRNTQDRIESSGEEFFLAVIRGYQYIAEIESDRFITIDAKGNIEDTHNWILNHFKKRIRS